MPRSPRADEAGGLYHVLNRDNLRADIFKKEADYVAFERILHEGLEIHEVQLYCYQLLSNHDHLVLRPLIDGEMSRFMDWVGGVLTPCVTTLTTTPAEWGMFINNATKSFRFKTMNISSWSVENPRLSVEIGVAGFDHRLQNFGMCNFC